MSSSTCSRVLWCPGSCSEICISLDSTGLLYHFLSFILMLGMIYFQLSSFHQCNLCSSLAIPLTDNEEGWNTECFRTVNVDLVQWWRTSKYLKVSFILDLPSFPNPLGAIYTNCWKSKRILIFLLWEAVTLRKTFKLVTLQSTLC